MTDSPIADEYDRYRLLAPQRKVVMVDPDIKPPGDGKRRIYDLSGRYGGDVVDTARLSTPTRLQLQLSGEPDSEGGLLEDVRPGDIAHVGRSSSIKLIRQKRDGRWDDSPLSVVHRGGQRHQYVLQPMGGNGRPSASVSKGSIKLATPTELSEHGVAPEIEEARTDGDVSIPVDAKEAPGLISRCCKAQLWVHPRLGELCGKCGEMCAGKSSSRPRDIADRHALAYLTDDARAALLGAAERHPAYSEMERGEVLSILADAEAIRIIHSEKPALSRKGEMIGENLSRCHFRLTERGHRLADDLWREEWGVVS